MNLKNKEVTLLTAEQVFSHNKIDLLNTIGTKCNITDFAILLGGIYNSDNRVNYDQSLKGRISKWYTSSADSDGDIVTVSEYNEKSWENANNRRGCIRPVIPFENKSNFSKGIYLGDAGVYEVEYGEYPQYVVSPKLDDILNNEYSRGKLKKTGKYYTTDSATDYRQSFKPVNHEEYEYKGKKYVRMVSYFSAGAFLSNDTIVGENKKYWLEVAPIKWYIDDKSKLLVSKSLLASGVRFCDEGEFSSNSFSKTEMYMFLNSYFAKDMIPSVIYGMSEMEKNQISKKSNPFNLKTKKISEEEIIKGSIESNIAVFLHGQSSEGKSARVKQIDPDCTIIYLRNATPDSLNGKSVYDSNTGKMIDIKPSWLKKLEEKCEKEPDKLHILFFDELTNALPSIQGMAFNIILDKEVNGIWKLPDNARIVAAGNEMSDSISANRLAEPLFNRFAHVYIKTTTESWLEWASKNNIHPAIYSFVAYKSGEVLRSKFDGEKPNADPRKWEMASNMLYATENPEMIRSLVGEDITNEFVEFCNQQVITLDDVITGKYTNKEIESLNTSERHATVVCLSQANEEDLETVREFVTKLGNEFISLFDSMWTCGDESKLEKLAEVKLAESEKKLKRILNKAQ